MTTKARSFESSSVLLQHSVSDTNLCCALSSTDTNFIQSQNGNIKRSQSKRGLLQRGATIDMEDTPASNDDEHMTSSPTSPITDETGDVRKITFSIDRPDDEDDDDGSKSQSVQSTIQCERKARPFRHSYSDQPTTDEVVKNNHNNNFLVPYRHSFEQQHEKRILPPALTTMAFASGLPIPLAPYSAESDPGPYHSPWSITPTNPYGLVNFHFPKSQEHLFASAQGSIAQLSTLTKFLCDEPSVFTPINPR
jgi:hypothetical protein